MIEDIIDTSYEGTAVRIEDIIDTYVVVRWYSSENRRCDRYVKPGTLVKDTIDFWYLNYVEGYDGWL